MKQSHYLLGLVVLLLISFITTITVHSTKMEAFVFEKPVHVDQTINKPITTWLDVKENQGIVYFLFDTTNNIKRYDLATQIWLADISLPNTPTAFTVDNDGLYVSFGFHTYRFALSGTNETFLYTSLFAINTLFTIDNRLYIYGHDAMWSLDKETGLLIDEADWLYRMSGITPAPTLNKAFGRSISISPATMMTIGLNEDGTLGDQVDGPYRGDYPIATETFVSPDEDYIVDNSGTVYHTDNLTYKNSLAGSFDDLTFYEQDIILLRDNFLIGYANFVEFGRLALPTTPNNIFIYNDEIFAFAISDTMPIVQITPISNLQPIQPSTPVDPHGLAYTPDQILLGNDETVYLFSKEHRAIFRWSPLVNDYLDTIALIGEPAYIAYSGVTNHLYFAYPAGEISGIDLDNSISESLLFNSRQAPLGLSTVGEYIFICDLTSARSHFTYHPDGTMISKESSNYYSAEYVWSEVNQKIYHLRDGYTPNDLFWEDIDADGVIGDQMDSPYHDSVGFEHPIHVSPTGEVVLLGSGRVYDAFTLEYVNDILTTITDATWLDNQLFTLRAFDSNSQLQKWDSNYTLLTEQTVDGTPLGLFATTEGLLTITSIDGIPNFSVWTATLNQLPLATFGTESATGLYPLTVAFTNETLTNTYESSLWDFGDGITSTLDHPTHTYNIPGLYSVTLTVESAQGIDIVQRPNYIQVYQLPSAGFSTSVISGLLPLEVQFINQSVINVGDIFLWDFGDGNSSTEENPVYIYSDPGVYSVSLTVTSIVGVDMLVKQNYIQVYQMPTANFSATPTSGKLPLVVHFSNLSNMNAGDTFVWDFGDGINSHEENPIHTYDQVGTYSISLTVSSVVGDDIIIRQEYIEVLPMDIYLPILLNPSN